MTTTEQSEPVDWRKRLYSLPSGTAPFSNLTRSLLAVLLCFVLFIAGSIFVLMCGAYFGLSLGFGPEQSGGALYVLLGLIGNMFAGMALAAFLGNRSDSRHMPRLVFYSFTAPAFIAVTLFALALAFHR